MTDSETYENGSDSLQDAFIRGLIGHLSDPGETAVPMATDDAEKVVKAQLTENTGAHLLDSGSAYGRHWEENQDNPPWERPRWDLSGGFPVENVYHRLAENVERDRAAVALEAALYGYGRSGDRDRDGWLTSMEDFAGAERAPSRADLAEWFREAGYGDGDPVGLADTVSAELPRDVFGGEAFTMNTYNSEFADASQVLQFTAFGGPYAEYVAVQVHGGCDVRGGYTAPRVYRVRWDGAVTLSPGELYAHCERCGWSDAESVLWDTDALLWQDTPDPAELHDTLAERGDLPEHVDPESDAFRDAVSDAVETFESDDDTAGACFHVGDGCGGPVRWRNAFR